MKLILHPQFEHLRQFVEELPQRFSKEGEVLQDRRNTIKVFHVNGLDINVKRFRIPFFFNRIIYTFFRASKASKAYLNALEVLRRGFETPHCLHRTIPGGASALELLHQPAKFLPAGNERLLFRSANRK